MSNVSIMHGDALSAARTHDLFNFAHERLVLINMPISSRQALIAGMVKLVRPGGVLALESWDRASLLCYPEHPSWQILNQAYPDVVCETTDGACGRTLSWLLRWANVTDVRTKVHVRAVEVDEPRRMQRFSVLDVTRHKILCAGLLSEAEFDQHRRALSDHLADPNTLVIDQLFVHGVRCRTDCSTANGDLPRDEIAAARNSTAWCS